MLWTFRYAHRTDNTLMVDSHTKAHTWLKQDNAPITFFNFQLADQNAPELRCTSCYQIQKVLFCLDHLTSTCSHSLHALAPSAQPTAVGLIWLQPH